MDGRFSAKIQDSSLDYSEFHSPLVSLIRPKLKACVHSGRKTDIRFS